MSEAASNARRWSDAVALVGEGIGSTVGPDVVTVADIRRKLEVIGLDCPLHYDDSCARSFGYRTIVSPVSMTRVWSVAPTWQPGAPRPGWQPLRTLLPSADPPGHGDTLIAARVVTEHHEPVYPGDRVSGKSVLEKVAPKTTRVGPGAFLEVQTTYANQDRCILTVERATLFRFDRRQGEPAPPISPVEPDSYAIPAAVGFGRIDGIRHYEHVTCGEPLPPVSVPITLQRLVMEAGANRDFSPWHFDVDVARTLGAPTAFANTTLIETLLEAAVRRWGRLGARIRRLEFAMTGHNCAGDVVILGGSVLDKYARAGEHLVTLELWIDCPRGRSVTGSALVSLPPRQRA